MAEASDSKEDVSSYCASSHLDCSFSQNEADIFSSTFEVPEEFSSTDPPDSASTSEYHWPNESIGATSNSDYRSRDHIAEALSVENVTRNFRFTQTIASESYYADSCGASQCGTDSTDAFSVHMAPVVAVFNSESQTDSEYAVPSESEYAVPSESISIDDLPSSTDTCPDHHTDGHLSKTQNDTSYSEGGSGDEDSRDSTEESSSISSDSSGQDYTIQEISRPYQSHGCRFAYRQVSLRFCAGFSLFIL